VIVRTASAAANGRARTAALLKRLTQTRRGAIVVCAGASSASSSTAASRELRFDARGCSARRPKRWPAARARSSRWPSTVAARRRRCRARRAAGSHGDPWADATIGGFALTRLSTSRRAPAPRASTALWPPGPTRSPPPRRRRSSDRRRSRRVRAASSRRTRTRAHTRRRDAVRLGPAGIVESCCRVECVEQVALDNAMQL
jgi:hypothetical protein